MCIWGNGAEGRPRALHAGTQLHFILPGEEGLAEKPQEAGEF